MISNYDNKSLKRKRPPQTEIYTMNSPGSALYEVRKVKLVEEVAEGDV